MKTAIVLPLLAACLLTSALNAQLWRADPFQPINVRVENLTLIHGPGLLSQPGEPVPGQRWTTVKTAGGTLTLRSSDLTGAPKATGTLHLRKSPAANVAPETLRSHSSFPQLDMSLGARSWSGTLQLKRE